MKRDAAGITGAEARHTREIAETTGAVASAAHYAENARDEGAGRSWTRLDGVDLLRGVAIFFVLMNHVNMQLLFAHVPYTRGLPDQLVYSLVWNGQFGVQIFFAVSGFLITATTLRRWGSLREVRVETFYRIRFARIAPLFLGLLALLSVLHLAHVEHFVVHAKTGGLGRALLAALTFHVNLLEARRDYLPGNWDILWSLSIEELFYLVFPVACVVLKSGRWLAVPLVALVAIGPFARSVAFNHNPVWREYSYLGGMDAIAMGCLTALLLARRTTAPAPAMQRAELATRRLAQPLLWAMGVTGGVLVVFSLCFSIEAYRLGLGRNGLNMTVLGAGACLLIAVAAETRVRLPRLFLPVLALGRRSYEVYLTHMFLVPGAMAVFVRAGKPLHGVPLLFLTVILLAGLVGEAIGRVLTDPANRWFRGR